MAEFLDIVLDGPVYLELVVSSDIHVDVEVPLQQEMAFQTLTDFVEGDEPEDPDFNYIGKALAGKAEDDSDWTIDRLEVAADGSVIVKSATGVKWTERLTVTYT